MDLIGLREHVNGLSVGWGDLVRERRRELRLTQAQLAALVGDDGITVQAISRIERGELRPRDYVKVALALALACEVSDLFPMPPRRSVARFAKKAA